MRDELLSRCLWRRVAVMGGDTAKLEECTERT